MPLFGNIPDLDSMVIVSLVTAIEEHFAVVFVDEDMTMDTFASLTKLAKVVHDKLSAHALIFSTQLFMTFCREEHGENLSNPINGRSSCARGYR